jgi:hypothetical protein
MTSEPTENNRPPGGAVDAGVVVYRPPGGPINGEVVINQPLPRPYVAVKPEHCPECRAPRWAP